MPLNHVCAAVLAAILTANVAIFAVPVQASVVGSNVNDSAQLILQRYAAAWRGRQEMELQGMLELAFWVRGEQGGEYTIILSDSPGSVVKEGVQAQYDIGFELDIDFLRRLDQGEIGALTAMGQARSTDPIPLNPKLGSQFSKRPDASVLFRQLCFHFWNRDWPEIVPFGESAARLVHGGNASVLIYQHELRTAWYQLKPGMHINADRRDQKNNFPQLLIVTRGQVSARLDGRELVLLEGQAVFIPSGMSHEFWAEGKQYCELIWIAFGAGT
jgi:mannose-6-phosphate isomerase-like protein (cupin superfamily)